MIDLHQPPPAPPPAAPADRGWKILGGLALGLLAVAAVALVALVVLAQSGQLGAAATPAPSGDSFAVEPRDAPPLDLVDQDGQPFGLANLRGAPALVFFGYTHCPDVCPATVGNVNQALAASESDARVVFVSIDPERDTPAEMQTYVRYLPDAYTGLSGTPAQVRAVADAWGVSYAKIDTGSASGYAMAHTADLWLLDASGRIRAVFPFGTDAGPIGAALEELATETAVGTPVPATPPPATAAPSTAAPATPAPGTPVPGAAPLSPLVASSSVWAGGQSPVILRLFDEAGTALTSTGLAARAQLTDAARNPVGPELEAIVVRPKGVADVYVVATVDIASPGAWGFRVAATDGAQAYEGWTQLAALDPGDTPALGGPAPTLPTPTLRDVGGLAAAVTTAPVPDLRLSTTSTAEATAAGRPYVLLVDSYTFKVSPACGRALVMARFLLDRWTDDVFIHLEPYEYTLAGTTPVLAGTLQDPVLNRYAKAWGLATGPWTKIDVPWVFVVDGDGIVRAKSTGIVGSADVDVILAMLEAEG